LKEIFMAEVAIRIGEAWRMHREGRSEDAVVEFERIIKEHPDNVDAHYGLGLAQRTSGHQATAKSSFEQALILIDKAEAARRAQAAAEGRREADGVTWNDERDHSYDHFLMMKRLIGQRLSEVNAAAGAQK
jgi:tetratricopeptide (TPR) repeat protein